MLGLGISVNRGGFVAGDSFVGLLNESFGGGAAAAYSVRRLSSSASTAMTIRRDSDQSETDIGFVNGNLDEAAINTFCTGTTCKVSVWKDQSGNDNHATQTTAAKQPTIYTGGAIVKENGRVALDFSLLYSPLIYSGQDIDLSSFTAVSVGRENTIVTGSQSWAIQMQSNNNDGFRTHIQAAKVRNRTTATNVDYDLPLRDAILDVRHVNDIHTSTSVQAVFINGTGTTASGKTFSTNGLDLAVGGSSYDTTGYRGVLQEALLFNTDKYTSGDIVDIRENIGDYFTQNTPLLDTYTGAAAAYSLRKLSSDYSGPAIRVRRDNDNLETDINFNVFGELDTVSLAAHCGSNNGYVTNWYDQSSNSNTARQTTAANQPKIYDSVTGVVTENGKPAVDFLNGSYTALKTGNNITNSSTLSFYSVFQMAAAAWQAISGISTASNVRNEFKISNSRQYNIIGTGSQLNGPVITIGQQTLGYAKLNSSSGELATNSNTATTGTNTSVQSVTNAPIALGSRAHVGGESFTGTIQEVIYWIGAPPTRSEIETNINTFYDIY